MVAVERMVFVYRARKCPISGAMGGIAANNRIRAVV
jgi:hypothetical protein